MISCAEFIPAYSELFQFLERTGGKEAVVEFWCSLSDAFLTNLKSLAEQKGLAGCYEYWEHTLTEEAADCRITLDPNQGLFQIDMYHCPSRGRLNESKHLTPYPNYCEHCDVLYRRVLEPLGYEYEIDLSHCDEARCRLTVREKRNRNQD
jgi:hypothetical protein